MEWVGLILLFAFQLILNRDQKKLKSKIESNSEYIKDLYRIDDERLLHKETD